MTYQEIHDAANGQLGPFCKNCPVCNGRACANSMPGPGSKPPGNVAARNYDKWQEICVNMDTLCPNVEPDIGFDFAGKHFSAPIFAAPIGALPMHYGPKYEDQAYNEILVKAAADYGVAGGKDCGLLFRKGQRLRTVPCEGLSDALVALLREDGVEL